MRLLIALPVSLLLISTLMHSVHGNAGCPETSTFSIAERKIDLPDQYTVRSIGDAVSVYLSNQEIAQIASKSADTFWSKKGKTSNKPRERISLEMIKLMCAADGDEGREECESGTLIEEQSYANDMVRFDFKLDWKETEYKTNNINKKEIQATAFYYGDTKNGFVILLFPSREIIGKSTIQSFYDVRVALSDFLKYNE